VVTLTAPGGWKAAWVGDEPLDRSNAVVTIDGETATVTWPKAKGHTREVYLSPVQPVAEVTHSLSMVVEDEGVRKEIAVPKSVSPEPSKYRLPLFKVGMPHRMIKFTWGFAPVPNESTQALQGRDSETNAMLEAMGYVADDDDEAEAPTEDAEASP
jgi:hypothetical protein